jgi:mannobiose 2-epimerase
MNTPKTMNTNLHVMEAFSCLGGYYRDNKVIDALENLVEVFLTKIILSNRHFGLFFGMDWKEASGKISFGHDIEGSWLLTEAAKIIGKQDIIKRVSAAAVEMADVILREGMDEENGIYSEQDPDGSIHKDREWWMQVEAMVGFLNAYEMTKKEIFLEKSLAAWEYCKKKYIRPAGEWYSNLDDKGNPDKKRDIAGPWKCPYHTGRACLEIYDRIGGLI